MGYHPPSSQTPASLPDKITGGGVGWPQRHPDALGLAILQAPSRKADRNSPNISTEAVASAKALLFAHKSAPDNRNVGRRSAVGASRSLPSAAAKVGYPPTGDLGWSSARSSRYPSSSGMQRRPRRPTASGTDICIGDLGLRNGPNEYARKWLNADAIVRRRDRPGLIRMARSTLARIKER
jgi:hypothetical protein